MNVETLGVLIVVVIVAGCGLSIALKSRKNNKRVDKAKGVLAVSKSNDAKRTKVIKNIEKHQEQIAKKVKVEEDKIIIKKIKLSKLEGKSKDRRVKLEARKARLEAEKAKA
jgi:hypothetical protein